MKTLIYLLALMLLISSLFSFTACTDDGESLQGDSTTEEKGEDSDTDGGDGQNENKSESESEGGEKIPPPKEENMITLNEISSPVSLAKPLSTAYLSAARSAYKTPAYASYTSSVIGNYPTASGDFNDRPNDLTLSFSGIDRAISYILELSTTPDFTAGTRRLFLDKSARSATVSNLYTGTVYFWRVTAVCADKSITSAASSFTTAENEVRWIAVDGVRNVRDVGGWTGLKQGMVYRGSEMNLVANHGLQITEKGKRVLTEELGIKTDLDFRAAADNGSAVSPLGADVYWCNRNIGNFLTAFSDSYRAALAEFAKPENYPIYMHCWGGADRTGTLALMLEGLCGVREEDLAIDLELTSFASFGYRYRYDNGAYLYASTLAKIKNDYEGDTLQKKFESYALDIGLSRAEISNIQSLLSGSGATFGEGARQNVYFDPAASSVILPLSLVGQSVEKVTLSSTEIPFRLEGGALVLSTKAPTETGIESGILTVHLSDGETLKTDFSSIAEPTLAEKIAGGDLKLLFGDGTATYTDGTVRKPSGSLTLTHTALTALREAGYTAISFRAEAVLTAPVSSSDSRIRLLARWTSGGSYLASDKQDLTATAYPTTVSGTLTVHLTAAHLSGDGAFILVPQSGGSIILSDFEFIK